VFNKWRVEMLSKYEERLLRAALDLAYRFESASANGKWKYRNRPDYTPAPIHSNIMVGQWIY